MASIGPAGIESVEPHRILVDVVAASIGPAGIERILDVERRRLVHRASIGPAGIESWMIRMMAFAASSRQSDLLVLKGFRVLRSQSWDKGRQSDLLVLKGDMGPVTPRSTLASIGPAVKGG